MNRREELLGIGDRSYYTKWYRDREPKFYTHILQEIIAYGSPGAILDIGCGIGLFIDLASKWGLNISGCDGSEYAVQEAAKRMPDCRVELCALPSLLPYETSSFENVLLNQVIEHLPAKVAAGTLAECHRVLRPGGMLFIFSPSSANTREVKADPTHCNPLLPSELKRLLTGMDFVVTHEPNSFRWVTVPVVGRVIRFLSKGPLRDRTSLSANAYARRI
jgi:SAM-dependent methyltransferase